MDMAPWSTTAVRSVSPGWRHLSFALSLDLATNTVMELVSWYSHWFFLIYLFWSFNVWNDLMCQVISYWQPRRCCLETMQFTVSCWSLCGQEMECLCTKPTSILASKRISRCKITAALTSVSRCWYCPWNCFGPRSCLLYECHQMTRLH